MKTIGPGFARSALALSRSRARPTGRRSTTATRRAMSRGNRKQLQVTYYCGGIVKSASAAEHRTIYLDCRS